MTTNKLQLAGAFAIAAVAVSAYATETGEKPDVAEGAASGGQTQCYDFSNLSPGTRYHLGDSFQGPNIAIEMKRFHVERGEPSQMDDPFVEVRGSKIAQETAPELWMNQLNIRVTPSSPVSKVEIQFAENVGSLIANIEVNGNRHVIQDGLAGANGKTLGKKGVGKAAIIVNYDSTAEGTGFNRGELRMHATKGKIETWSIGGQHLYIDNVCFTT